MTEYPMSSMRFGPSVILIGIVIGISSPARTETKPPPLCEINAKAKSEGIDSATETMKKMAGGVNVRCEYRAKSGFNPMGFTEFTARCPTKMQIAVPGFIFSGTGYPPQVAALVGVEFSDGTSGAQLAVISSSQPPTFSLAVAALCR